ncbi:MAG: hypothetical protein MZW92_03605 [Comamonadaceae bacterium]|nr:hypothetical protein [Comamonadaceae bacterium]
MRAPTAHRNALLRVLRGGGRAGDGAFWYGADGRPADGLRRRRPGLRWRAWRWSAVPACRSTSGSSARTLRPRPYQVSPDVVAAAAPLDQFSFPSGHTLHAVSFTTVVLRPLSRTRAAAGALRRCWWRPRGRCSGCTTRATCWPGAALGGALAALVLAF